MARKVQATPGQQVTANAQDIGYVLGKMEMIEKKFDEQRIELKSENDEILAKLDELSKTMSFWRHSLWIVKAIVASIPLLLAANYTDLTQLWKDM
jgi:hypothetical protein